MSINNKTILILTAQFGAGHISAAKAIKDYILEEYMRTRVSRELNTLKNTVIQIYLLKIL